MKSLGIIGALLVSASVSLAPCYASAKIELDGSRPFTCVPTAVSECGNDGNCKRGTAESENLPQLFTVDLHGKRISAEQKGRHSTIARETHAGGNLILSGGEAQRVWSLIINQDTGDMTGNITGDGESFAVFGVCLEP